MGEEVGLERGTMDGLMGAAVGMTTGLHDTVGLLCIFHPSPPNVLEF
jgi:hypothetical protein